MNKVLIFSLLVSTSTFAESKWVSFDQEVKQALEDNNKSKHLGILPRSLTDGVYYSKIKKENLPKLSRFIKKSLKRHGGFIQHPERPSARKRILSQKSWRENNIKYSINKKTEVKVAMDLLSEPNISKDIIHLTSYHTRYHASKEGLETMQWIYNNWKELTAHRNDVSIEYYKHKESPQPSVILTIKGKSDKRIIVGGHADSINTDDEGIHSHAPGANDNAAGIGVLNEILRVLMKTNFKPTKTVQFIAYAAEEVGILGSYEIAREYAEKDIEVDGILQIDGVNYKGTTYDMALIDDNTSKKQNNFLAMIIDEYLKVNWGYVPCGYGCSDHAAWNYESYHASFPVDAIPSEQNPYEHTSEDTFDKSNNNAVHALMFAKIGVAYTIELDNL